VAAASPGPRTPSEPGSFERAPAHREAATVATEGPRVAAARTTPSEGVGAAAEAASGGAEAPALRGSGDTSGPVVISVGDDAASAPPLPIPVTTADGRFAISSRGGTIKVWDMRTGKALHTFEGKPGAEDGEGAPAGGTLLPAGSATSAPRSPAVKRGPRARSWALVATGALIAGGVALLWKARLPASSPPASRSPAAATATGEVTVRLAVTPPDADVIVDGVRMGTAAEPLSLPRSDRRRALRLERRGFEAETLWIVPDRDSELPPIALHPASPGAPDPGSAAPRPAPAP